MNERQSKASLESLFRPRSVAVVGASRDPSSMSGVLLRNLKKSFRGPIYPVNPHAQELEGLATYPTLADISEQIDLAFVAVRASQAVRVTQQCIEKGIKSIVMISAGFSETGAEGKILENELKNLLSASSTRLIGPNCMGIMNTDVSVQLNGSFGLIESAPGNVAIASQSGALGFVLPDYIRQWSLGISTFASIGNKLDVNENDLLDYWAEDSATDVIQLYLESFRDPCKFRELASRVTKMKPIVALKAGRTKTGSRAASSHTAALASRDALVDALFSQAGVIRADSLQELFDVTAVLATQPLPKGKRVAILSDAGGPAVLCVDALEANGLEVPTLTVGLQRKLRESLRLEASVANPIDLIGTTNPNEFRICLQHLLESKEVDSVIVIYVGRLPETDELIATAIHETAENSLIRSRQSSEANGSTDKGSNRSKSLASHPQPCSSENGRAASEEMDGLGLPAESKVVLAVFMRTGGQPRGLTSESYRIPSFMYPESAAHALARAVKYAEWRRQPSSCLRSMHDVQIIKAQKLIKSVTSPDVLQGRWLLPDQVEGLLQSFGLPYVASEFIRSEDQAIAAFKRFGKPVGLKVVAEGVLHKSDTGGVVLNLRDRNAVCDAYQRIMSSTPKAIGVLVQPMIEADYEMMIGATRDPQFGPLVAFGSGGTMVEWLNDIVFRLAPLTDIDIEQMLWGTNIGRMARHGFRQRKPADLAAIEEMLARVSVLVELIPEVCELDFNPVMLLPAGKGALIVDARIRVATQITSSQESANLTGWLD